MIEYGLVGERLGHSYSPEIHSMIADYKYELIEVPPSGIDAFFDERGFMGLNVTIPYKETVIPHLDEIDDAAREIGAVNTIVNRGGKLTGYNTDWIGMQMAMLRAGVLPSGKKVLICGTGGTSKTAAYVARQLGAKSAVFLSRSKKEGCSTYEEAASLHRDAGIIINATPCGMYPDDASSPIDISAFPELSGVFDAVFNPLKTNLVLDAAARGIPAAGGLFMLVAQAIAASEKFTGRVCSKGLHEKVYGDVLKNRENIVLTGMPSSGKSTVGAAIAKSLGRELVDTDALIFEAEGRSIPEIFASDGEDYFRDAESLAINKASQKQGVVIATGGGAVLRAQNVRALRRNGRIYFLDRSLEKLVATSDRPLSSDKGALEARYRERIDIYRCVCDAAIDSDGTVEEAAKSILEEFDSRRDDV